MLTTDSTTLHDNLVTISEHTFMFGGDRPILKASPTSGSKDPCTSPSRMRLVNWAVLVALGWPNHVHHRAAIRWFASARDRGWSTCSITQTGFVRFSANPAVTGGTATAADAVMVLRDLGQLGLHRYVADGLDLMNPEGDQLNRVHGYRQVTDAHLLALARDNDAVLVTFDRGTATLDPSGTNVELLRQ